MEAEITIEVKDGHMMIQKEGCSAVGYDIRYYNGNENLLNRAIVNNLNDYLFFISDDPKMEDEE